MSRRDAGIACLVGAFVVLTLAVTAMPAGAAAPRDQGWWTVTSPGLPGAPTAAPPDVPARGLLIQGGATDAPVAFAAVLYELDPGTTAGRLTLSVAPNSLTTPSATLELCPLIQPIVHQDQGGPMSEAPAYNCGHTVTATPAPNGKDYQFDASGLVTDRLVAVAILPTGPTDRVVLNPPGDTSLATQAGSTQDTVPATGTSTADASSGLAPAFPPDTFASSPVVGSLPTPAVSPPAAGSGRSPAVSSGSPSEGTFVPTATTKPEKATPLLVLLLVAGTLGGAGLWLYAGRQPQVAPSG